MPMLNHCIMIWCLIPSWVNTMKKKWIITKTILSILLPIKEKLWGCLTLGLIIMLLCLCSIIGLTRRRISCKLSLKFRLHSRPTFKETNKSIKNRKSKKTKFLLPKTHLPTISLSAKNLILLRPLMKVLWMHLLQVWLIMKAKVSWMTWKISQEIEWMVCNQLLEN